MMPGAQLHCPIRGLLDATELAADGLHFTEEKRRIDCINFLLAKGYPKAHFKIEPVMLRFGHGGKNSLRADFAVFDAPVKGLPRDPEEMKKHIRLVAEIKRDNADAKGGRDNQLKPALALLEDFSAYGVYWDDVEQRLFYRTMRGLKSTTHETTVAVLPMWGAALSVKQLTAGDLRTTNLHKVFVKVEDRLHSEIQDKDERFEVMLQLLLAKLHDEHTHAKPSQHMTIQDFTDVPIEDPAVIAICEGLLDKAASFYGKYLPKAVSKKIRVTAPMLRSVLAILAPVRILGSKRAVVQDFYMYFAQGVYRWDLAQYFTPTEVVDFIVSLVNPHAGDSVRDPACGSGDFLISCLHYAKDKTGANLADAIWGSDNSPNAVQVCVLNMVLNGDGKSNIAKEDSLVKSSSPSARTYSTVLCNPPFGVRIVEKRFDVLRSFDLGHRWAIDSDTGAVTKSDRVLDAQETGILFAELCVRQTEPGGRIGIILPNGYLGNGSAKYLSLREWLLCHTKLVAVVGFPRFTFKKSGADVSASVLILERREEPLLSSSQSENYPFYAGILESVGWKLGDSRGEPVHRQDPASGMLVMGDDNEPILDADFDRVLRELWSSNVAKAFPWLVTDIELPKGKAKSGWSLSIKSVLSRADLSIDPKRWCKRAAATREHIASQPHFMLRDVVDTVPTEGTIKDREGIYYYADIDSVGGGVASPTAMRGWQLPDRAKHGVSPGDIFVGGIWSSVSKWFVASSNMNAYRASSGFLRLRLKNPNDPKLLDLLAGLNSEAYRIQARSICTGSDGLATMSPDDLLDIVLPTIGSRTARSAIQTMVTALLEGQSTISSVVDGLVASGQILASPIESRSSHVVQV